MAVWEVVGNPVMDYGEEVWGTRNPTTLERARRHLGRSLIGAPSSTNGEVIMGELGWIPIKARWDAVRLTYWYRLCKGRNELANWVYTKTKKLTVGLIWAVYTKRGLENLGFAKVLGQGVSRGSQ